MLPITAAALEFVRNPGAVGSAFPASRTMVRRVLAPLDWSAIDVLVEFGPGTGRFTLAALARLKRNARLLAIEPGEAFLEHLRSRTDDARLILVKGEAQDVREIMNGHDLPRADCILSGLPFSTLAPSEAARIAERSRTALSARGVFVAYQMRRDIERFLDGRFEIARKSFALWNLPPCHLYWARPAVRR